MALGTLRDRGAENDKRAADGVMERGNLVLPISESCRLVIRLHYSCVVFDCEPVIIAWTSCTSASERRRTAWRSSLFATKCCARAHLYPGRSSLPLGDRLCSNTSTRFDAETAIGSGPCIRDTRNPSCEK